MTLQVQANQLTYTNGKHVTEASTIGIFWEWPAEIQVGNAVYKRGAAKYHDGEVVSVTYVCGTMELTVFND